MQVQVCKTRAAGSRGCAVNYLPVIAGGGGVCTITNVDTLMHTHMYIIAQCRGSYTTPWQLYLCNVQDEGQLFSAFGRSTSVKKWSYLSSVNSKALLLPNIVPADELLFPMYLITLEAWGVSFPKVRSL